MVINYYFRNTTTTTMMIMLLATSMTYYSVSGFYFRHILSAGYRRNIIGSKVGDRFSLLAVDNNNKEKLSSSNSNSNNNSNRRTSNNNNDDSTKKKTPKKEGGPHPRNFFKGSYDMDRLASAYPTFDQYIIQPSALLPKDKKNNNRNTKKTRKRPTINFSDPKAVRSLNTALLVSDYGIKPNFADILPEDALVPPIPGRADYVHHVADVILSDLNNNTSSSSNIPKNIKGMDIGTGASCIYPLIATSCHEGWKMIASEINPVSILSAREIVKTNDLDDKIDVRQQDQSENIFDGILLENESIDFAMCNPPFYSSAEEFQAENARKRRGLAKGGANKNKRVPQKQQQENKDNGGSNNFGGTASELWCEGGEIAFVSKIIQESSSNVNCLWFSSLVSRKRHLEIIEKKLGFVKPKKVHRISLGAGTKQSYLLFWSFLSEKQRQQWAKERNWI